MTSRCRLLRVLRWAGVAVFMVAVVAQAGPPPKAPKLPKIPGLTARDTFPKACVSCHRVYGEKDYRLSTALRQWEDGTIRPTLLEHARATAPADRPPKGKHPKVSHRVKSIPRSCLKCHKETSKKAPPFGRLLHRIHLTGGAKNRFLTEFRGTCTHCHKLDRKTGAWRVPSAAEPAASDAESTESEPPPESKPAPAPEAAPAEPESTPEPK